MSASGCQHCLLLRCLAIRTKFKFMGTEAVVKRVLYVCQGCHPVQTSTKHHCSNVPTIALAAALQASGSLSLLAAPIHGRRAVQHLTCSVQTASNRMQQCMLGKTRRDCSYCMFAVFDQAYHHRISDTIMRPNIQHCSLQFWVIGRQNRPHQHKHW